MPRKSLRKQGWDYSSTANYFITINLNHNSTKFGVVTKEGVKLNELGELVKSNWEAIPQRVSSIRIGEFVIMPDHLHGIIYFTAIDEENKTVSGQFGSQRKNLPAAIRGFKSGFTALARATFPSFVWQKGYHDVILFSPADEQRMIEYIRNNPQKAMEKLNE